MARLGAARRGKARLGSQGMIGMARLVGASQGKAVKSGRVESRSGTLWVVRQSRHGKASPGTARQVEAVMVRRGEAGHGRATLGEARRGKSRQSGHGHAGQGTARQSSPGASRTGWARHGTVWRGSQGGRKIKKEKLLTSYMG